MKKRSIEIKLGIVLVSMLVFSSTISIASEGNFGPELEISKIKGGIARVSIEIHNIGDSVAENITSTISVKGGFLNRIDIFDECSGCGHCNNSIPPGEIKMESTHQFIFGLGPIDIIATANASGVPTIENAASGFVIGPIVIIN
jgi:hypothetical protein